MKTFWLVLVTIVWGSTFFIVKDTVGSVNEYLIVFIRSALAFAAMFLYQIFKDRKKLLNKKAFIYGSIMGVLMAITYGAQTIGLKFTSTGHSAFITSSAVIIVPFILFFFYKAKLLKIDILAVSIVFGGLFLLTYDFETKMNVGDIITIITAISYAFHVVLAGQFIKKADAVTLVTYQFFASAIVGLAAFIFTDHETINISAKAWGSLIYLGLFGTLFCYFITVWVMKYVSALKVAIIFSLEPVFAAIIGYFAIHEILNSRELIGASFILLGVIVHSILKNKK
ncbi:MAG: EamA family transporter [Bacteroidales bacterium]|nr:EamA family transporter [Bacteroidales bacterium]